MGGSLIGIVSMNEEGIAEVFHKLKVNPSFVLGGDVIYYSRRKIRFNGGFNLLFIALLIFARKLYDAGVSIFGFICLLPIIIFLV